MLTRFSGSSLALLVVLLGSTISCTQTPTSAPGADEKTREAEVRQVLDRWVKAFDAKDLNGIKALYAPDVFAYDIVPPLQYNGRDAYMKDYESFLAQYEGPIDVQVKDVHIVSSDNLALVASLEDVNGTVKGKKVSNWLRVSSVLRKTDGAWLIVHDHVSVPTDMDSGKALLDLKP